MKETDLSDNKLHGLRNKMGKMLTYSHEMLRDAILSFSNQDAQTAYKVINFDDKVDELFHQIKLSLQEIYSNKENSANDIKTLINIESIAHNIERVGDSATNIAEAAIYLAEGKDIRHGNKE